MARKPAKKPRKTLAKKRNYAPSKNVSVDKLILLAESRFDSEADREAFESQVVRLTPGTVGAEKLVTAGDALEDGELLLELARRGFVESLRSLTLRARINDEVASVVSEIAECQAAVGWSSADERWPGAWIVAQFGDAIAVNGELLNDDDKTPERPEGYVVTDHGGDVPVSKEIVRTSDVIPSVLRALDVSAPGADAVLLEVLDDEYPHGIPVSVRGATEVWADEKDLGLEPVDG